MSGSRLCLPGLIHLLGELLVLLLQVVNLHKNDQFVSPEIQWITAGMRKREGEGGRKREGGREGERGKEMEGGREREGDGRRWKEGEGRIDQCNERI